MKSIPPINKVTGYGTGNVYIIEDGDDLVLVDTGVPQDYMLLVDRIKSLGRSPVEVAHVLLTHFHVDHAGSAAAFKRLSHCEVYAHEADVPFIQGEDSISSIYPKGVLGRAASLIPVVMAALMRVPPVEVSVPCHDGQVIDVMGGIRVIHAPGHTPGTCAYFWEEKGILFTGDAIINTYHLLSRPTVGFSCDFDEASRSACKLVDTVEVEGIRMICCGHGPVVQDNPMEKLTRLRGTLMKKGALSE
jgi:glyoxylase-like metal-dependent hydrolase (beta-lactamase superfamily II)